jgi:hypothetical protein
MISRNGKTHPSFPVAGKQVTPELVYDALGCAYPKFFKMDLLCKWAWLAAEYLLVTGRGPVYEGYPKEKTAVVLFTGAGCLEADKRYQETLATIPSPALFVYTLPNIMLGEISIRHGFKGEQLCMVQNGFDSSEQIFWVNDLLEHKEMDACLCGWVDVTADILDVCMFWVARSGNGAGLSVEDAAAFFDEQLI